MFVMIKLIILISDCELLRLGLGNMKRFVEYVLIFCIVIIDYDNL